MAKNTLTSKKKKVTAKKKDTEKKTKAVKKGSEPQVAIKTKGAKKTAAPAKGAPGVYAKNSPEKTIKNLLMKKFDSWTPEKLFSVESGKPIKDVMAPPAIVGVNDADTKRIKNLLSRTFSPEKLIEAANAAAEKAAAEKAAAEKAAAEKAAAEKAAAEKAAAEKAAAEKAAAEKAAAEKAAAEKAAAEKAAAEKAAAEKAAAEKAAAEKAAAEKAAAEKAAAEKAAAEKAAAEKAAAEKAAAEKAAAEKAAAGKAAAEKAAAEKAAKEELAAMKSKQKESPVSVTYQPPKEGKAPMDRSIKYAAAAFTFLIVILVGTSFSNMSKFYIKPVKGAIQIWQGRFSPLGAEKLITLHGAIVPKPVKAVYSRAEVYPLIFNFYLHQADRLLKNSKIPDFNSIQKKIKKAMNYAVSSKDRQAGQLRLETINILVLLYKAEVSTSLGTNKNLEKAMDYLNKAGRLDSQGRFTQIIAQRTKTVTSLIAALQTRSKAAAPAKQQVKAPAQKTGSSAKATHTAAPAQAAKAKPAKAHGGTTHQ